MGAILNKSWRQHCKKQQLFANLQPIMKTIKIRRSRHARHCWRSCDELISDVLLWTSSHGRAKAGRPARTYIQQLCADTGCSPEDLPEAMGGWRERVRDIHVGGYNMFLFIASASRNRTRDITFYFPTPVDKTLFVYYPYPLIPNIILT